MRLFAVVLLSIAASLAAQQTSAAASPTSCETCAFTLSVPSRVEIHPSDSALILSTEGFRLEARTEEADFGALVESLDNAETWRKRVGAWNLEFQDRRPERGTYRGRAFAARAGTAIVKGRATWLSWIAFDHADGRVTTLVYLLAGNPSAQPLLKLYDDLTTSLRWKNAGETRKAPKAPEPSGTPSKGTR